MIFPTISLKLRKSYTLVMMVQCVVAHFRQAEQSRFDSNKQGAYDLRFEGMRILAVSQ